MTQERNGTGTHDGGARPPGPPGSACAAGRPDEPVRRTIRVINPRGLHPRIIDLFTKTAKGFDAKVTLWNGDLRADGKDVWDLITLVVMPETDVVLEIDGPDAAAAADPLTDILASPGGEDYTI